MISDIKLANFRSYKEAVFEFNKGVNIIVGPNASGKTNLLEAILVLCSGGSYRVKDIDLLSFNQPWTRIDGTLEDGVRKVTIENVNNLAKKKFNINGNNHLRLSLSKKIPVVVFEPDHLMMLHGSPDRRREYLDNLLEQTINGYTKVRRDYRRTLAQRNSLLKQSTHNIDNSQLFAWNVRLSELGGTIVTLRNRLLERLNTQISELYGEISHKQTLVKLEYQADAEINNYSNNVLRLLSDNLSKDIQRGFTGNGPHRHDVSIKLKSYDASVTASRGESRTLLLALKLLELKLIEEIRDKKPLLLLDDVFSELDGARRKALTKHLQDYQTFITTTDADIVVQHFIKNSTIIPLG
ncbi:DNA replication and repair protein RecF [Candidatus Saccharibacteria bacterium]|nr:DNA replication and repair protein RecF [Candidatus Saccharibacteria bacterium]